MISYALLILLPISVLAQFIPRYPYYSPQEFLLDYMDASPSQLSFSMDSFPSYQSRFGSSQAVMRDLPISSPSQTKFDPFARQPGMVPKLTGYTRTTTSAPVAADPFAQPGAAPKFTGRFLKNQEQAPVPKMSKQQLAEEEAHRKPDMAVDSFQGPVTNPAAHFLKGTNFEKIATPKCRLLNCAGPVPNDGSLSTGSTMSGKRSACSQVLVPINGCADGEGYPMAMLCSMCCECTVPLVSELLKTAENFRRA